MTARKITFATLLVLVPFGYVLLTRFQWWCAAVWEAVRRPADRRRALAPHV